MSSDEEKLLTDAVEAGERLLGLLEQVKQTPAQQYLEWIERLPLRFYCPDCEQTGTVDEDACCVTCGRDTFVVAEVRSEDMKAVGRVIRAADAVVGGFDCPHCEAIGAEDCPDGYCYMVRQLAVDLEALPVEAQHPTGDTTE